MKIIIEGLDGTGKTTLAHHLAQTTGQKYLKIKKEVPNGPTQQDTTRAIIEEISVKLGDWTGVLDRGYLSALGTSMALDPNICPDEIAQPRNLYPDIGVLVVATPEIIRARATRPFTLQDERVLNSDFARIQQWMTDKAVLSKYFILENNTDDLDRLYERAERVIAFYTKMVDLDALLRG